MLTPKLWRFIQQTLGFSSVSDPHLLLHELGTDVPIKSREILSVQPTALGQVTISSWSRHLLVPTGVLNPPSLELVKTYLYVLPNILV